ncbi:hypothetical protein [Bradyrhizobium sp. CER78]|uniref:hypothetical protein n=1 Tax=Bradyrhizobium sp. CER78 TaxID=3039162 RepID=UPI002446D67F|nr:hypothetical protein [Bradyrhizobium sp. CER78]MDH2381637.1 hypothetical protein [Bradyrhizobium sp. CER78]
MMTSINPIRIRVWSMIPASASEVSLGHILRATDFPGYADCCSELKLNHDTLAKLTVTIIVLVALLVWRVGDQKKAIACGANCPTDVSASRKPAQ